MKRLFFAVLAVATLASCAKEEAIRVDQGEAIAFGDAFVDNATRAIYESAEDITGFTVFGQVGQNVEGNQISYVALYGDGAEVTRNGAALGAAWSCNATRYWIPSSTFNFAAIANGTASTSTLVNGLPTKIDYTVVDLDPADLIYATATATTDAQSVPTGNVDETSKVVKFSFKHLLSRVKVSFVNLIQGTEYTYKITNVKVTTWNKGTYTIGETTPWTRTGEGNAVLNYNDINSLAYNTTTGAGAKLVIPGSSVTLSFEYELLLNGTKIYGTTVTKENVITPQQNYSYNITVQLKAGNMIDFTVDSTNGLTDWPENPETVIE